MEAAMSTKKIPVVYYLSRNRHLEHPHFVEVPLSSPDGALYLRDVLDRLNAVRGKGMPAMYSWSCKRSYKNGFVWQDLANDDLVLPANGDEYVLKGTELSDQSTPDANPANSPNQKRQQNCRVPAEKEDPVCSSPPPPPPPPPAVAVRETKSPPPPPPCCRDEMSPPPRTFVSYDSASPRTPPQSHAAAVRNLEMAHAAIQTDDEDPGSRDRRDLWENNRCSGTLESLIRAEINGLNRIRRLREDDEVVIPSGPRLSPANLLMQFITCGSISVKDNQSFRFMPSYKSKLSGARSPSWMLGDVRYSLQENRRPIGGGLTLDDKDYSSGSIVETKKHAATDPAEQFPPVQRSSSYNADRFEQFERDTAAESSNSKLTTTLSTAQSPISYYYPRKSSSQLGDDSVKRVATGAISTTPESSTKEKEKLVRIEERLISGARVTIQSRVPFSDSDESGDF